MSAAANVPALSAIAWTTLGVGIVFIAGAAVLIVAGSRPRRLGAAPIGAPVPA